MTSGQVEHRPDGPPRRVFTYLTGQYDNLGDALLRRALVREMSRLGTWEVYVGNAGDDYVRALHLPASARVHRSRGRWLLAAGASLLRRSRAVLVVNPGEVSSTRIELLLGLVSSALLVVAKIGRNPGYRLGIGARDRRRPLSIGHEIATALATRNVWRDAVSRDLFGRGEVAPDWAFALPTHDTLGPRDLVVVTYRGDKAPPSLTALRAVRDWATARGFELVVTAQVRRDDESADEMARQLGVRHVRPSSPSLTDIEELVHDLYHRAVVVLSNRIHALIVGALDGAAPGAILAHPDVKIERTLRAGHLSVTPLPDTASTEMIHEYLDGLVASAPATARAVERAAADLRALASEVCSC